MQKWYESGKIMAELADELGMDAVEYVRGGAEIGLEKGGFGFLSAERLKG
jgi:hypothetical protein